jgi:hypothetical protein
LSLGTLAPIAQQVFGTCTRHVNFWNEMGEFAGSQKQPAERKKLSSDEK